MKRFLHSIWFLAFIIAVPVIVFLPNIFQKYNVNLLKKDAKDAQGSNVYFRDLNNDGNIEKVEAFKAYQGESSLFSFQCFKENGAMINQYNFDHSYHERLPDLFFEDIDEDGFVEVYGFTINQDSVFINWIEPFDSLHECNSKFLLQVDTERRKVLDVSIKDIAFFDFDGDKNKEAVFSFSVGYNWFPRKMIIYHPEIDSIYISKEMGIHFSDLKPFDYNSDGTMELLCTGSSADNIPPHIDVPYRDNRPRFMVFDNQFNLVFEPIEFPTGVGSKAKSYFLNENKGEILTSYLNFTKDNTGIFLTRSILDGRQLEKDTLKFPIEIGKRTRFIRCNEDEFMLFGNRGKIYWINKQLHFIDSIDLEYYKDFNLRKDFDFFSDGIREYIASVNGEKTFIVYFENFEEEIKIKFSEPISAQVVINGFHENEFIIIGTDNLFYYRVSKNPFYWLKVPIWGLIYLLCVLFIWIIQSARMRQIKEKHRLQDRVLELQLMTLKNQLDPHFINNTFNTVASVIKQGRNDEAYDLFVLLSKMIRNNLQSSNEIYTTIKKELDFVKDYLQIQKFRFPDMFDYVIELDRKVKTDTVIPKMLIQIHVENAIKHGLRHKREKGSVVVRVSDSTKKVYVEIEDSGIGREKSRSINGNKSGIGLKTIKQIIDLNNTKRLTKIHQNIIDLYDSKLKPTGTKVMITINKSFKNKK